MSLFKIAWRSIQQRGLASSLTMLSMALGVMLVVAVLLIHGVVSESFRTNSSLGYNMIVGAKGGKLQLTLNTVYYLSQPVENIPYDFYLDFLTAEEVRRLHTDEELDALVEQRRANATKRVARELAELTPQEQREQLLTGPYAVGTTGEPNLAIPVCLGDYYKEYRLVGTSPKLFDELVYDPDRNRKFEFAEGQNFPHWHAEYGYFTAVVGSTVANQYDIKLGDKITPSHGAVEGEGEAHDESPFYVVGILAPSGTPNDRAVFINIEGFYLMDGHAKVEAEDLAPAAEEDFQPGGESVAESSAEDDNTTDENNTSPDPSSNVLRRRGLPIDQREVTAILVLTDDFFSMYAMNDINEGQVAQAAMPSLVITSLFEQIVTPIQWLLLAITAMICVVSGVSILVSIYNSMSDRKHEIAVMRALGASRKTVMAVVLLESIILALGGGLLGWLSGHVLIAAFSGVIESRTGVAIGLFDLSPGIKLFELLGGRNLIVNPSISAELLLVPALMLLAIVVGFLPAMAAYRTDVAKSLQ